MICRPTYFGISLAGRRNRRWLVIFYWLIVLFVAAGAVSWFRYLANRTEYPHFGPIPAIFAALCAVWLLTALGGMGRKGPISNFEATSPSWTELWRAARGWHGRKMPGEETALDERDIRLCNAAHYEAYKVVRFIALSVPVLIVLFGTILRKQIWLAPSVGLVLLLVVFNLPQTLILWWEPDMEEKD
jgi:uncharacterized membrane protein YoaK (UPF0700 family)